MAENEQDIEQTKLEKDLGIVVVDDFKWTGHVYRMVRKASNILEYA